ncbi:nuclear transport factor 2 family protein [Streptomyces sp. NPDC002888]|uniref:nuclear transport factor 2 family protein n=1 Tax=Streptomyces sp. NPDC002888 TaxID=3364668 RepID=UPI0036796BF0
MTTTAPTTARDVALAWLDARVAHNLDAVVDHAADDIVYDAPGIRLTGKDAFREAEAVFLPMITGVTVISAFGDDTSALLMYSVDTAPVPANTTGAHLTVTDGKISALRVVYDQTPFAALQGGTGR